MNLNRIGCENMYWIKLVWDIVEFFVFFDDSSSPFRAQASYSVP
jgi:hypothetical protein